jgi:hypothetical protein
MSQASLLRSNYLALEKMVRLGFLRLIARGGPAAVKRTKILGEEVNPRMRSIYRFIGRVVNGVIVPGNPAAAKTYPVFAKP